MGLTKAPTILHLVLAAAAALRCLRAARGRAALRGDGEELPDDAGEDVAWWW